MLGGDVLAGPWPLQTLRLLQQRSDVIWIRGNADRELAGGGGRAPTEIVDWVAPKLDAATLEWLVGLPLTVTLDIDAVGPVLFCHATPRSDTEIRTLFSTDDRWLEVLDGVSERVVVCGHTHVQFDRTVAGNRIVNAGSVGMAYANEPGAYWALLGPEIELRRTTFDVPGTVAAIAALGWPGEWPQATADEATAHFEALVDG